jgi:hypothetical protein
MALSYLLETIVEKMDDLLTISKLEGDAVFAYIEESKLEDCARLLELIDQTYLAFRDKALTLYSQATCPCRACQTLPILDLKFILHHGDFVMQRVAGIHDLLGTDVNVIHRLLKNGVAEATGWKGYAVFTDQALERMKCSKDSYLRRCETYEHLGDVNIYCMDMHARYAEMKS